MAAQAFLAALDAAHMQAASGKPREDQMGPEPRRNTWRAA
jgi:hypothetical protein